MSLINIDSIRLRRNFDLCVWLVTCVKLLTVIFIVHK